MRLSALSRSVSLCLVLPATASAACLADGAHYRMVGDPEPRLVMERDAANGGSTGLSLLLSVPDRPEPFRFTPVQSQGYGSLFAVPVAAGQTNDAAGDAPNTDTLTEMPGGAESVDAPFADADFPLSLFGFAADGKLVPYATPDPDGDDLPGPASPAPDAIFMAQLGSNLWYGTNGSDRPVILPQEIWYLDCP